MKIIILLLFTSTLLMSSCYTYEPRFEGPLNGLKTKEIEFIYIKDNVLFMADKFISLQEEISTDVIFASINNAHTKIVYKNINTNIQIYDIIEREVIGEIPNSNESVSFDFASDDETIYYINEEGLLRSYGSLPFDFQEIDLSQIIENGFIVNSCVLFPNNSIAISGFFNNGEGGLYYMNKTEVIKSGIIQNSFLTNLRINNNGSEITCTQNLPSQSLYKKINLESFSLSLVYDAALLGVPDNNLQAKEDYIIYSGAYNNYLKRGEEFLIEFEYSTFQTIDN